MGVKKASVLKSEEVGAGKKTRRQILIGPDQGPNFSMRKFILQAGGSMPMHTNTVEHEQYVLAGKAVIGIGDQEFEVEKDDVIFIPRGMPHWYRVKGEDDFAFLCLVPNEPDTMRILE